MHFFLVVLWGFPCDWNELKLLYEYEKGVGNLTQSGDFSKVTDGYVGFWDVVNHGSFVLNPSTSYAMTVFPEQDKLIPSDYPFHHHQSNNTFNGTAMFMLAKDEALVTILCTPPEVQYFGWMTTVFQTPTQSSFAEFPEPLNQQVIKTNADPGEGSFSRPALVIMAADQVVAESIAKAFPLPANFIKIPPNVNLIDRSKSWTATNPYVLLTTIRCTKYKNQVFRKIYEKTTIAQVSVLKYEHPVNNPYPITEERDSSGSMNELHYEETMSHLVAKVIEEKTYDGEFRLYAQETLGRYHVNNSWYETCVSDHCYLPVPLAGNYCSCHGATRDALYQMNNYSAVYNWYGDGDRFFVYLTLHRTKIGNAKYHSLMVDPLQDYERGGHTISVEDEDGAFGAKRYLPLSREAEDFSMFSFYRTCPNTTKETCVELSYDGYPPNLNPYWMDRSYLNSNTSTAPDWKKTLPSVILTFEKNDFTKP